MLSKVSPVYVKLKNYAKYWLMFYHKFQVVLVLNKDIKLSNLRQWKHL